MFNKIIIRKPKFMRNDKAMDVFFNMACKIINIGSKEGIKPELKDKCDDLFMKYFELAAKTGGFRNARDYYEWCKRTEGYFKFDKN